MLESFVENLEFIAAEDRDLLEQHGLASFKALWALQLDAVDEPNINRGGWSSVHRLDLDGASYFLKRQSNYLTRSWLHPFGEPTLAREFRSILKYQEMDIPTLQPVFFATHKVDGEYRAILMTRALDGWQDLEGKLRHWSRLETGMRAAILQACGELARRLHGAGQIQGCLYPKHIFMRETAEGFETRLIDLEKTRTIVFGERDRVKDLDPLLRRAEAWSETEVRQLLEAYVGEGGDIADIERLLQRLGVRRRSKRGPG